ncbi:MAG: hypothetical protein JNJ46_08290 [Myxococcales bacterium]|nr:hypothetical protein [Myxococcales bacterium]
MGRHVLRRAGELAGAWILAPERYDPRRLVAVGSTRRVAELVDFVTDSVHAQSLPPERPLLVLDTSHAYDGFVVLRHAPGRPADLGSAKRTLQAGDVLVSRLRPYLRQIAYVDEDLFWRDPAGNDVCGSSEFFVLRSKAGFDAAALVPFLLSPPVQAALSAGQEGGHHPRFSRELLATMPVPDCVVQDAAATAQRVRELARSLRHAMNGLCSLVMSIQNPITERST